MAMLLALPDFAANCLMLLLFLMLCNTISENFASRAETMISLNIYIATLPAASRLPLQRLLISLLR